MMEEELWKTGKRRQMELMEEESEWRAWVEKQLERIKGLLEGLGLKITAFQEALSILAGKISNEDLYGDRKGEGKRRRR